MKKILQCLLLSAFLAHVAYAGSEYVTVIKVLNNDDNGIIERSNGERWLIEKGVGALSFWRFEGKKVLIQSPGIFCGVGSKVILPDVGQEARIWDAKLLDSSSETRIAATTVPLDEQLTILGLTYLGYYDPKSKDKNKRDAVLALKAYQKQNRLEQSGKISSSTQLALSKSVSIRKPLTKKSLALASRLLDSAKKLTPAVKSPSGQIKPTPTVGGTIESQIDGDFKGWEGETVVKLMNGQIWQQTEYYYYYHYAYMPKVVILKSGTGYEMFVDGVPKGIGVTQLK